MNETIENRPKPLKENKEIYKIYFDVLSRISNQLSWLLFTLVTITATIALMVFAWEMGGIKMASKRELIYRNLLRERVELLKKESVKCVAEKAHERLALINDSIKLTEQIIGDQNLTIEELHEVKKRTLASSVPFLGITLGLPDFSAALYMISFVFLVSVYTLLKYLKNVLKNYFNIPADASKETASVHNLFYLIYPGNERITNYKYLEWVIYFYLMVLMMVLYFDVNSIFSKEYGHSIYDKLILITKHDNLKAFSYLIIELVLIMVILMAFYFSFKIFKILKDIRNILILVRWQRPFVEGVQELLKKEYRHKLQTPMVYYGLFDYDRTEKVLYKVQFDGHTKVLLACVDLASSLYTNNKEIQPSEFYRVFHKADLEHHEIGDEYMKLFFKKIVSGVQNTEEELANSFNIAFADYIEDRNTMAQDEMDTAL